MSENGRRAKDPFKPYVIHLGLVVIIPDQHFLCEYERHLLYLTWWQVLR